ncbi:MAG: tetratricopeptide repeat protein [Parvibaculaceae bacterium]|nr:tetratricopeptide repeat protein [Parvibaculaceae bacterium]
MRRDTKRTDMTSRSLAKPAAPLLGALAFGVMGMSIGAGTAFAANTLPPVPAISAEDSAAAYASLQAGVAALQTNNLQGAIDFFGRALQGNALDAEKKSQAFHYRGVSYFKLNMTDNAIADFTSAIWQNGLPDEVKPRTYYNRAVAYARSGETDRALSDYEKAIQFDPGYARAYHNRGNLKRMSGDYNGAAADYKSALSKGLGRSAYLANYALAVSLDAMGQRGEARGYLAASMTQNPGFEKSQTLQAHWQRHPGASEPVQIARVEPPQVVATPVVTVTDAPLPTLKPTPKVAGVSMAPIGDTKAKTQKSTISQASNETPIEARSELSTLAAAFVDSDPSEITSSIGGPSVDEARAPSKLAQLANEPVRVKISKTAMASALRTDALLEKTKAQPGFSPSAEKSIARAPRAANQVAASGKSGWEATVTRFDGAGKTISQKNGKAPSAAVPPKKVVSKPMPVTGPYRVQVGSFRSPADAEQAMGKSSARHKDLLATVQPFIAEADLGARGIYYRLQYGAFTKSSEAKSLCKSLKAAGTDCLVQKVR